MLTRFVICPMQFITEKITLPYDSFCPCITNHANTNVLIVMSFPQNQGICNKCLGYHVTWLNGALCSPVKHALTVDITKVQIFCRRSIILGLSIPNPDYLFPVKFFPSSKRTIGKNCENPLPSTCFELFFRFLVVARGELIQDSVIVVGGLPEHRCDKIANVKTFGDVLK